MLNELHGRLVKNRLIATHDQSLDSELQLINQYQLTLADRLQYRADQYQSELTNQHQFTITYLFQLIHDQLRFN